MVEKRASGEPDSVILSAFSGIRNTVNRERLAPEDLETAQNVHLDDVGQLMRRRGKTRVAEGDFHSLYRGPNHVYGVRNGDLGIVEPDYTFTTLVAGLGADQLAYTTVNEQVYYVSRTAAGKLTDRTASDWGTRDATGVWVSPVVNPTATLGEIAGRRLTAPPHATALAAYNGRIYLADEKVLWATELYQFDYVERTRNFIQMEAPITALGVVTDGLYISTTKAVYFMSGGLTNMQFVQVVDSGAVPGSMIPVPADRLDVDNSRGGRQDAVMFVTPSGVWFGLEGGKCTNVTTGRVDFPKAASAAAMLRQQDGMSHYVGVLESEGTPTSTARIGDYVDAEIRRFQGA